MRDIAAIIAALLWIYCAAIIIDMAGASGIVARLIFRLAVLVEVFLL